MQTNQEQSPEKPPRSHPSSTWWQKHRTAIAIVLITVGVALMIVIPIVVLQQLHRTNSQQPPPPAPTESPSDSMPTTDHQNDTAQPNPYDDTTQANAHVPPLSQDFQYTKEPIRGINLGGWLVLEPFITPSLFEHAPDFSKPPQDRHNIRDHTAPDEWTLCERLGPIQARQVLEHHYDTFIQEADFQTIRRMGFNHVRIPVGHWAIRPMAHEPFVPYVAWSYLVRGIQWARKYGLRVMVELHTAPGSQNGWNHSGRSGEIRWLNGEHGHQYAEETLRVVKDIVSFFNTNPEEADKSNTTSVWSHVVPIIGVLNEPAMMAIKDGPAKQWYHDSHDAIRNITGYHKGPYLSYHDGFLGLTPWKDFFKNFDRSFLETHMYLIFDPNLVSMDRDKQSVFPCHTWGPRIAEANSVVKPTMVGEFSFATNDCGKYLNGVGVGTRYEKTMDDPNHPHCSTCKNCSHIEDWGSWTSDYKHFLNTFVQRQMHAFESGVGWFFWTYKTENHINPHWDYSLAWEKGWAPLDVNERNFTCNKI